MKASLFNNKREGITPSSVTAVLLQKRVIFTSCLGLLVPVGAAGCSCQLQHLVT